MLFFSVKQNLQFFWSIILFYFIYFLFTTVFVAFYYIGPFQDIVLLGLKSLKLNACKFSWSKLQIGCLINGHPITWTSLSPLTPLNSYSKPSLVTTWLAVNYSPLVRLQKTWVCIEVFDAVLLAAWALQMNSFQERERERERWESK